MAFVLDVIDILNDTEMAGKETYRDGKNFLDFFWQFTAKLYRPLDVWINIYQLQLQRAPLSNIVLKQTEMPESSERARNRNTLNTNNETLPPLVLRWCNCSASHSHTPFGL